LGKNVCGRGRESKKHPSRRISTRTRGKREKKSEKGRGKGTEIFTLGEKMVLWFGGGGPMEDGGKALERRPESEC